MEVALAERDMKVFSAEAVLGAPEVPGVPYYGDEPDVFFV